MSRQSDLQKLILELHLSSSDVADALGRKGRWTRATQMTGPPSTVVGPVFQAPAVEGSNWLTHKLIATMPEGVVLYVDHQCLELNGRLNDLALVGGLMCDYAYFYRRALAVVVDGNVRDVEELQSKGIPVWARGSSPIVCDKLPTRDAVKLPLQDGVAVCDATGVVVIQTKDMTPDLDDKLKAMAKREESWFRQLQEGKSTFEITCEK
jgi:4-hydroxy-4-methyl-2-oxoglutarate aldolase